ncbi:DUF202 domain-containing protein [Aquirufa antheringensis]|jgi:putative membrane protein
MNKDLILRENLAIQRTIMANQTTFLSFIRTSMYFLVAGLSVQNIVQFNTIGWAIYLFYGMSILGLFIGVLNYFSQKKRIKEAKKMVGNAAKAYVL